MDERAARLLEAHVAHELERLRGASLRELIDARVADLFGWFDELPLEEAVRRQDVVGLAERYALELRVSGGISELAGEMARVVLTSGANAEARVSSVVSSESFEEFLDKVVGLDAARGQVIALVARSEALGQVTAKVIAHVVTDLVRRAGQRVALGPAAGLTRALEQGLLPELERRVGVLLGRRLTDNRALFAEQVEYHVRDVLDGPALQSIAEELWLHLSRMPLEEAYGFLGERDLEDFVVLCFEFWLRFRKTPYLRRILAETIGHFFDKYGEETVSAVITDLGVSSEMVANELKLLLVPLVEKAAEAGFLQAQIRAHLEAFYASDACANALS